MSDIFVTFAVFLFNAVPYVVIISLALIVLNGVRKQMVARRKRLALARRSAANRATFNTFDVL